MADSNPIEQRIELVASKWENAKKNNAARVVRLLCQDDEMDMIDCFYDYMIGVNTPVLDIAFHFESACGEDLAEFGKNLLAELNNYITIWNQSEKEDPDLNEEIKWKPDYTVAAEDKKNPAALFVRNMHALANVLDIDEGLFVVAIFLSASITPQFNNWLAKAIDAGINKKIKFLLADAVNENLFDKIAVRYPAVLHTIAINLDMPNAMLQIAAMGNPNEPVVAYRVSYMKMLNAIKKRNEKAAEEAGAECERIARTNIAKDAYWIAQLVAINLTLGNDKMGYKKYDEAYGYADKSFEAAAEAEALIGKEVSDTLMAQTLMFRGTIGYLTKKWEAAHNDFKVAAAIFVKEDNTPLAIEAYRMSGNCAIKWGLKSKAVEVLCAGALLGENFDENTALTTTYGGLLQSLVETDFQKQLSYERLDEMATRLLGKNWLRRVKDWGKMPDRELAYTQQQLQPEEA